jgi:outer membrane biosynthesis protein TonB
MSAAGLQLLVAFIIFVLTTPIVVVILAIKQAKLSGELDRLSEEYNRQVGRLTSRIYALEDAAKQAETKPEAKLARTLAPVEPFVGPAVPGSAAGPDAPPSLSKETAPVPSSAPTPVPPPPAPPILITPPSKEPLPLPEPVVPPAPTPAPPKESTPPAPAKPPVPARVPWPEAAVPSQPAAPRVTSASSTEAFRYAAAKPTLAQQIRRIFALEETLGTNWLSKIGIIILVLGLALFGVYEFNNLGPAGKVAISYAAAIALLVGGILFEKRETYRILGRTFIGGGWALFFFCTYGIYHVAAMHVLNSLTLDCLLMLLVAITMGAHTLRYRSQLITGLAFLLGYTTIALSQDTVYALSAGVILAIGLVLIVLKMRWFELEVFGILSSYLNHLYWLYRLLGPEGAEGHLFPEYRASLAMLLFYWLIFRISYVTRGVKTDREEHVSTAAALLNTLLLLAAMKFQAVQPQLACVALLGIGLLELSFGQLPQLKGRRRAFVLLSVMGAALMIAAPPLYFSSNNVLVLWLLGAELFLLAGVVVKEVVFRRIGLFTGLLVGLHLAFREIEPVLRFRAHSDDPLVPAGVLFGLCAVVLYMNALIGGARRKEFFQSLLDWRLLQIHSYIGAASAMAAAWALVAQDWTAVAFAGIMLALVLLARRFPSTDLQGQYGVIGLLTFLRVLTVNLHAETPAGVHLPVRIITFSIVGAAYYLAAKLAPLREDLEQKALRGVFATMGSAIFGLLIWYEVPTLWQPVAFVAFAVLLTEVANVLRYPLLKWQANFLALVATVRTLQSSYGVEHQTWTLDTRAIVVSLVAAGLYFLARRASPKPEMKMFVAYVHSFAATGLLALLGWYQAPNGWLAPLWAGFALVLALIDHRFELEELGWQAHILSLLALVRCVSFNLQLTDTWHDVSVRLLSLTAVAVCFYAMTWVVRMPEEWREREFNHGYSWAGSTLVSLVLWYELAPLGIAIGWAVFGLVLFEYGSFRDVRQFRGQAYVALFASFVRIFFANLTAGEPGVFWGEAAYTVLPLVPIYFLAYTQVSADEPASAAGGSKKIFSIEALLATLGTATVVALFYFQLPIEWIVTSWAAIVPVLFWVAFLLAREIFLYQGLLLTMLVLVRGMAHNLFGAGYFTEGDWRGRFFVLGSAVALLLVSLVFAFPLRNRYQGRPNAHAGLGVFSWVARRPEQLPFFVATILLSLMLALKMRAGMVTVSWGIEGVLIIILALLVKERSFRLAGLGLLLLCVVKVMAMDVWGLQLRDRYITFIIVGAALIFVSYLYSRYRQVIRQLL